MDNIRLKKKSLTQLAIEKIEENINLKKLEVGDKIPSETELIDEFCVSRNTIREAISALENIGILEVRQGDGTYVLAKNRNEALIKKVLNKENDKNISLSYKSIKVSIILSAVQNCKESDLIILNNILNQADEYYKNNNILQLDQMFVEALANATHIHFLKSLFKSIYETNNIKNNELIFKNFKSIYMDIYTMLKNKDLEGINLIIKDLYK